jgi:hypothetical protein
MTLRWGAVLVVLVAIVAGCSSSVDPATETNADDLARAAQQLADPGPEVSSSPSSLAGVARWSVHVGTGVTVLGADDGGRLRAALLIMDGGNVACVLGGGLGKDCAPVAAAVAADLPQPIGATLHPDATIHPLAAPEGGDSCALCHAGIEKTASSTFPGASPNSVRIQGFMCNPIQWKLDDDACLIGFSAPRHAPVLVMAQGVRANCCDCIFHDANDMAPKDSLITGRIQLVCAVGSGSLAHD